MRLARSSNLSRARNPVGIKAGPLRQSRRPRWGRACAGLVFAAALACPAQDGQPATTPASQATATAPVQANTPADVEASSNSLVNTEAVRPQNTLQPQSSAENQRRKQISAESTQLLAMAVDLKAEVDKTSKDTLSINVIRKADAIEKLAKTVKEKIKQGPGPS